MTSQCLKLCRLLAVTAAAIATLIFGTPKSVAAVPYFEPKACDLPNIADVAPRVRCGVVRVPRDYSRPDGPTYALAVVIIASAQQPVLPDPVVYISGGPGTPLTVYAGYQAHHPYAPNRDLILVDQRGTGRSEPRLCPRLQGALVDAMLAVATQPSPAALAADRAVHLACRDAVRARGIDLDTFGTAATVEDYEWVRRAVGIAHWNVVGESYGTTVAMTFLARHPGSVRSVVLDSLNPPDAYFDLPWSARVAQARNAFLAACGSDPTCARAYPRLPTLYQEAVARLGEVAPTIRLPQALHVPGDRARLTPSLFEEVVGRLVYYARYYAGLPRLIAATRDGDLMPVSTALTTLLAGAKGAGDEGAFIAVECRDRPRWRKAAISAESPLDLALLPPGVCAEWSVQGPEPEVPLDGSVPILVLQGQFDPNIRPDESRRVVDVLGRNARWVEFAGIGHSVRHFSLCAQRLVATFIAAPYRELDAACATSRPKGELQAPTEP
jgi:pimeloyl-ACP methyl ester carboxylesterase